MNYICQCYAVIISVKLLLNDIYFSFRKFQSFIYFIALHYYFAFMTFAEKLVRTKMVEKNLLLTDGLTDRHCQV